MGFNRTIIAAKDGNDNPIPGGVHANDQSGSDTGPFDLTHIAVDSTGNEILGTTADVAWSGSGSASVASVLKAIWTRLGALALGAGSAIIGKVGIDQTTPGTTNGVVVNSGAVTANAGTNLNTAALALETGGNLAAIAAAVAGGKVAVKAAAGDLADGADTTIGAKADAANTATDVTPISGISIWKQISKSVQAVATSLAGTLTVATHAVTQSGNWVIAAGAAIIGKVGIDQTTPGTTNGVVVNSGAVTANAGTNLNTAALALETGGNLAAIAAAVAGGKVAVKAAAGDLADGADTTIGAKADAANVATDTTPVSGISIWKQISKSAQAIATSVAGTLTVATHAVTQSGNWVIAAGAAIIGKVGIDQTTPGTTNGVVVNSGAVTATLAAGSAVAGKVGIDQTTPGTTDSVTLSTAQGAGAAIGAQADAAWSSGAGSLIALLKALAAKLDTLAADIVAATGSTGAGVPSAATRTVSALASTGTQTSVAAAASDTTILTANAARLGFSVFNDSIATLYLLLANATSSTTLYSVQVGPGGYFDDHTYAGIVKGIWSAANGNVRVTEFA